MSLKANAEAAKRGAKAPDALHEIAQQGKPEPIPLERVNVQMVKAIADQLKVKSAVERRSMKVLIEDALVLAYGFDDPR
jgi:hypothetical protein